MDYEPLLKRARDCETLAETPR